MRTQEEKAIDTWRRKASGGTSPAHTWISEVELTDREKIGFYCWSQPACGVLLWHLTNKCHTITAIPANTCTGVVKCQALLPT